MYQKLLVISTFQRVRPEYNPTYAFWGARKAASAVGRSRRARGGPMSSAISVVRHPLAIGAIAVAVSILAGGAPLASAAPGCDGRCDVTVADPGGGGSSNKGGGSHGAQPTIPTVKLPPPAIINAQTVVQTAPPPPPPVRIPPPVIEVYQPSIPVDTQPHDVLPVDVAPSAVPIAPVPAEIPLLPPPPSAPPAPVSTPMPRVLFTSSAEPGTQALTLIVLFMACGCWIYGNRIASQMTVRKKERVAAGA